MILNIPGFIPKDVAPQHELLFPLEELPQDEPALEYEDSCEDVEVVQAPLTDAEVLKMSFATMANVIQKNLVPDLPLSGDVAELARLRDSMQKDLEVIKIFI